jgi:hypothetical protein
VDTTGEDCVAPAAPAPEFPIGDLSRGSISSGIADIDIFVSQTFTHAMCGRYHQQNRRGLLPANPVFDQEELSNENISSRTSSFFLEGARPK